MHAGILSIQALEATRETEPTDSPPPISRPPSATANGNSWSEWNLRQPDLHSHPAPPLPPPPLTPFPLPPLSLFLLSHQSLDYFKRRLRPRCPPSSRPRCPRCRRLAFFFSELKNAFLPLVPLCEHVCFCFFFFFLICKTF